MQPVTAIDTVSAFRNNIMIHLMEHPELFVTPIVRNGREATVGYHPEIWQTWE